MARKVFISKDGQESLELKKFLSSKGDELISHSFLEFTPVEFEIEEPYDIVFFGSPRAVIFFKSRNEILANAQIACVGKTTSEILFQMGYEVDFIGGKSGEINTVANDFKNWCGDKKVLFPISSISLKSVSSLFPEERKAEVIVYETSIGEANIPTCDIYILTSPSNVDGFLKSNSFPKNAQIIAWGESTLKCLHNNGVSVSSTLKTSQFQELMNIL